MFLFGHIGIGNNIASPWSRELPKAPLFLGMLLPDIIDKALYYGGLFPSVVTCTRTFGHTGVLLVSILVISRLFSSKWLAALSLGMATHLLLDCLIDRFNPDMQSPALIALTWPFLNAQFASYHFASIGDHLHKLVNVPTISAEIVGASFLGWDYWKSANRGAMAKVLFSKRWRFMKRHRLERD